MKIGAERIEEVKKELDLSKPASFLLRAGKKKFLRIIVEGCSVSRISGRRAPAKNN